MLKILSVEHATLNGAISLKNRGRELSITLRISASCTSHSHAARETLNVSASTWKKKGGDNRKGGRDIVEAWRNHLSVVMQVLQPPSKSVDTLARVIVAREEDGCERESAYARTTDVGDQAMIQSARVQKFAATSRFPARKSCHRRGPARHQETVSRVCGRRLASMDSQELWRGGRA